MSTPQSANSFCAYYSSLLILQYLNKVKASATIQTLVAPVLIPQTSVETISFSVAPTSGTFVFNYGGLLSATINWNDSASTIQTKIRAISGLSSITVSGSIASLSLYVTFTGVIPPALLLTTQSNSLLASSASVTISIAASDVTLPLAVMNGFNLFGPNTAVGAQLDILGKYAGVSRNGYSFLGTPITLDDSDFLSLIQLATIKNSAGSSLSTIQSLLNMFFPGEILVFDYANMNMSYLISSSVGSQNLAEIFVQEGLLPKPMGVQLAAVIYAPNIDNFFGFRTYLLPANNASPFNSYANYQTNRPWLSYADAIVVV